jgi:hypothetical protein
MYFLKNRFDRFIIGSGSGWTLDRFWFQFRLDPRPVPVLVPIFKTMIQTTIEVIIGKLPICFNNVNMLGTLLAKF